MGLASVLSSSVSWSTWPILYFIIEVAEVTKLGMHIKVIWSSNMKNAYGLSGHAIRNKYDWFSVSLWVDMKVSPCQYKNIIYTYIFKTKKKCN